MNTRIKNKWPITFSYFFIIITTTAVAGDLTADSASIHKNLLFLTSIEQPRYIDNIKSLDRAANFIEIQFRSYSSRVEIQEFEVSSGKVKNIIASFGPEEAPRIIVGAHYDVEGDQPGADDNASGVAGLIDLARLLSTYPESLQKRIDLVAYTLEEPPFFRTEKMGSFIHAKSLHDKGIKIELMISLEMIGYFTDQPGSQSYPSKILGWFYPDQGNFISVVSNFKSHFMAGKFTKRMKKNCIIPIERLTAPTFVQGVDFSDHLNYWHFGYKALMITDTAFLRNPNYHKKTDKPETLDYWKLSEVINGVCYAIIHL